MRAKNLTPVVLLYNLATLGKAGEVTKVRPGYAKNHLIPKKLAIYATKQNMAEFEKNKEHLLKQNADKSSMAMTAKSAIEDKFFSFVCKASDDGRLYGSVSAKGIADSINQYLVDNGVKNISISAASVGIGNGIKFIGAHPIKIVIHDDIVAEVSVIACRSQADIASFIAEKNAESSKIKTTDEPENSDEKASTASEPVDQ